MALEGHGYIGRCRFRYNENSTNCKSSNVTVRKMTEEEKVKYDLKIKGVKEEK